MMMMTSLQLRAGLLAIASALVWSPAARAQEGAIDDPFARPVVAPPAPPPTAASPLDGFDLTGVSTVGGRTMISLTDRNTRRSRWLTVGASVDGIVAAEFDAKRDAVHVVSGGASRWIAMRKVVVQPLSFPRRDDGSIDWVHIQMDDKQKAREAESMLTDILEVGRLARAGQLKATP